MSVCCQSESVSVTYSCYSIVDLLLVFHLVAYQEAQLGASNVLTGLGEENSPHLAYWISYYIHIYYDNIMDPVERTDWQ